MRISVAILLLCVTAASADTPRQAAEAAKKQGDAALAAAKRDDAETAYEKAIQLDPTYTDAYDAAAPIWFDAKKFDVAIAMFKQAVATTPAYASGWYDLAFAYRKQQQWQPAVDAYNKFTALKPDEPDPYFGLGMSYKALGNVAQAEAALQKYLDLEKNPQKQKFIDEAKDTITALKGATTGVDAAALKRQGDDLRAKGDLAGAEAKYRDAIAHDATYEPAHNELGALLFDAKKVDEAIAEFQQAVKLAPADDVAWYNLAHALRKANQNAGAVAAYKKYITLHPENPDPYYGLAQCDAALGDNPGAVDALQKYLNLEKRPSEAKFVEKARAQLAQLQQDAPLTAPPTSMPGSTDYHVKAGDDLFASKEYYKAAGEYKQADPHDAVAKYRLGVALAASGDLAAASTAWEGVLLLDPKNERARRNIELARKRLDAKGSDLDDETAVIARARGLVDEGRDVSAIVVLGELLARPAHGADPDALALRAEAKLDSGDRDGGLADLSAEVAVKPRVPRAFRELAEGWLALGDKAKAKYWFQLYFLYADDDPAEDKLVGAERKKAASL
jgi:tetratricopeptide (TPR) repeat protein